MTRRFAVLCAALLCLMAGAASAQAATALYPDLKTLPPRDLRFDRTDVSVEQSGQVHNVLRFSNTVVNRGAGKLVMRGTVDPTTKNADAYQRVFDDSGGYQDSLVGLFFFHVPHNHYHFDDWGQYQLWTKADYQTWLASGRVDGAAKFRGSKTTSCVMDEEFIDSLAATPWPAVFPSGGCMPNSAGLMQQGLSPGWGDTYDYWRFEQWIDLDQSSLADGDYVLRSVTDPLNKVFESPGKSDSLREGAADNEAITQFTVSGGKVVDSAAPTGTITVNHVDTSTTTPNVTVSVLGRDDVSGVDTVKLSNDGVTWATYAYTGTPGSSTPMNISWNLTDTAYGGTAASGTKTVYAQWRDKTGKWSTITADSIDYGAPTTPPPPTSAYGTAVLSDAPTGYWRLNESSGTVARDFGGTTAGTYRNGVSLNSSSLLGSDPDAAATFDGVNDYVSIPYTAAVDASNAVTVEAWIKPNALPAAGKFATVATKPESFSLQLYGDQPEFTIIQNGVRKRARAGAGLIQAGKTYHLVGTYDGNQEKLYINGKLVPSANLTGLVSQNPNGFYIGSWNGSQEYFNGTIDDVAVYKAGLSAQRVDAHYAAAQGSPPPPPPPPAGYATAVVDDGATGYWRLGETTGTSAADLIAGNAGTYRNGVLLGEASLLGGVTDNTSARFDGVNDSVAIPFNSGVDASTAVTVEAWIRPTAFRATGSYATVATKPESFTLQFNGNQLEFTIIQNGVRKRARANAGSIVAGSTYHVVGTYNGSQSKLYINGKLAPTANLTGNISQNPNGFYIGSWNGSQEFFTGWIDEVAVYKTALSASQVSTHYSTGSPGKP